MGKDSRWGENGLQKFGNDLENKENACFRPQFGVDPQVVFLRGKGFSPNSRIAGFGNPNRRRRVRRYANRLRKAGRGWGNPIDRDLPGSF